QDLEDLKRENEISIVEMDEMHTYIGNKKILLDLNCR
ncbi:MAG: transposase, partial [Euryarchaeota archaeon]|nr:transposase [Euryarchaeota archaeon]